ncbi:MAG: cysteine desulfurase, partial [Planctomycetota bacterium]
MSSTPSNIGKYFDHNGSTPLHPKVHELCTRLQQEEWGNAAAPHPPGQSSSKIMEAARAKLAASLGAEPSEIYFTSGGSESNNWALFGSARGRTTGHMVVSAIEHKSVLNAALELESRGCDLTVLAPRSDGAIHLRDLQAALRPDTFLVSVMWANNETGVTQPVREIATLCQKRKILFHCDAVAAMGKLPIDLSQVPCSFLSLSAHKFHAPKGTGALFIRKGTTLEPLLYGCGHESGLRSGTQSTVAIAGMAEAAALASAGAFGTQSSIEAR